MERISCSARKDWRYHIRDWLDLHISHARRYSDLKFDYDEIDYAFGSVETATRLCGGRIVKQRVVNLTKVDLYWLYDHGIGLKMPLSSKIFNDEMYKESLPFLRMNHQKGNAIITSVDEFSKRIKEDFPYYKIEASCIQDIDNLEQLEEKISLGVYDTIVFPIHLNDDTKFLESIKDEDKKKIRLFLNVECSYNCPMKICYGTTSKINAGGDFPIFKCSFLHLGMERTFYNDKINWGRFYFDKSKFDKMGFGKYKLVPPWEMEQGTYMMYERNKGIQSQYKMAVDKENKVKGDLKKRIKNLNKEIFFILGTARCRSSWFGNLFTYKDSFCYKEELRYIANWSEFIDRIEKRPEKYVGFSDPELFHFIGTLYDLFPNAKYVLLERDRKDAELSLATAVDIQFQNVDIIKAKFDRWSEDTKKFKEIVKDYNYLHWKDMDLSWAIEGVWKYILPNSKFDMDRWQLLASLKVKTTMGAVPFHINHDTCMAPYFNFKKLSSAK